MPEDSRDCSVVVFIAANFLRRRNPRLADPVDRAPLIRHACWLEATARKPGNVHPAARFADVCWNDFVLSANVIAPILARTRSLGVGPAIRDAVAATQAAVGFNTNLGIILLLAPLSAVPAGVPLCDGIEDVLNALTQADAVATYQAIRLAKPGGLGRAQTEDVSTTPTGTLRDVMALAADRDLIAEQYTTSFSRVFEFANQLSQLVSRDTLLADRDASNRDGRLPPAVEQAIVQLQLWLMADAPDSLIARKCGLEVARESSLRAARVLDLGWPTTPLGQQKFIEFDHWLRSDGHRRNPGTTADLIAAILFVALQSL